MPRSLSELKSTERVIVRHMKTHGIPVTLGMLPKPTVAKRMILDGIIIFHHYVVGTGIPLQNFYVLAPEWETAT